MEHILGVVKEVMQQISKKNIEINKKKKDIDTLKQEMNILEKEMNTLKRNVVETIQLLKSQNYKHQCKIEREFYQFCKECSLDPTDFTTARLETGDNNQ